MDKVDLKYKEEETGDEEWTRSCKRRRRRM